MLSGLEASRIGSVTMVERLLLPLYQLPILIAQESSGESGGAKAPSSGLGGLFENPLIFMVLALGTFYLMVLLPQQRTAKNQQKQMDDLRNGLKKNDRVITTSGIHGVVVAASADSPTVTIRIDDTSNAKLTLNKETIVTVVKDENKAGSSV